MGDPVVLLGHLFNSMNELQNQVQIGFKETLEKVEALSIKLTTVDKRVNDLEKAQAARDISYIKLLKPIHAVCVKTGSFHIQWPLETLEAISAVEKQMGDISFDSFLVRNIFYYLCFHK